MKTIDIVTLFPEIFDNYFNSMPFKKNLTKNLEILLHQLRDFSVDKQRKVDGNQFGVDPGMVLMPEPLTNSVEYIKKIRNNNTFTILMSPQGEQINHNILEELSKQKNLIVICGRYEGVDERFIEESVDQELSVGDFVVSGGELPGLILIEALARFLPGFLGNKESFDNDSFSKNFNSMLKGPVYTRPRNYKGKKVPDVLLSGDHKKINEWRKKISFERTKKRRNDLLK